MFITYSTVYLECFVLQLLHKHFLALMAWHYGSTVNISRTHYYLYKSMQLLKEYIFKPQKGNIRVKSIIKGADGGWTTLINSASMQFSNPGRRFQESLCWAPMYLKEGFLLKFGFCLGPAWLVYFCFSLFQVVICSALAISII